jgi:hypothetical protein
MALEVTIKAKVQEYIKKEEMFTSVDIANAIKREGVWVRVREVRDWLHANAKDQSLFGDYGQSTVIVCNGSAQATLYHPIFKDASEYTSLDQVSLTPDEVKDIQKKVAGTTNVKATPDITAIFDNTSTPDLSVIIKSKERIKIPGEITRKLGLKPGDRVDPALIKTHTVITKDLYVNSDYRISIPRSSVNWAPSPVKVMLKDGEVVFDKA